MDCSQANREYMCNCLLVKALLQFLSAAEREKVHEWLDKLNDLGDELPEAKIRNEYTSYLLTNVQNGRLSSPFNRVPTCGKLRPLSRVLPEHSYEDAVKKFKLNFCFMNTTNECEVTPPPKPEPLSTDPAEFRNEQPRPRKGIVAYCSAFSKYDES